MRKLASQHEATEAAAHKETLMAMRSTELARTEAAEVDNALLTARRLQSMSETFLTENPWMEQVLTKLQTSFVNVQEQLNKRSEDNQHLELELVEARAEHAEIKMHSYKSEEASNELQEHVQQLMLASSAACEVRNAEASLDGCEEELETLSSQLESRKLMCQQISEERNAQLSEAKHEGLLVEELRCKGRQLELKAQRAEAKLHTQERRYNLEQEEWHRKLRQMQHMQLPDHSQSDVETVASAQNEALATQKKLLQKEAKELEGELEAARRQHLSRREEAEARHQTDEIRKDALLQEMNSVKGQVAALTQEADRLEAAREPKTAKSDLTRSAHREQRAVRPDAKRKDVERLLAQQEKQESQLVEQIDASKKADPCFKLRRLLSLKTPVFSFVD